MAAANAAAVILDPEQLEELARLALEVASALRAAEQKRDSHVGELAALVGEVLPEYAVGAKERLARLNLDTLAKLEGVLEQASTASLSLAEAETEVRNAVNDRNYAAVAQFANGAAAHRAAFDTNARQIREILQNTEAVDIHTALREQPIPRLREPAISPQSSGPSEVPAAKPAESVARQPECDAGSDQTGKIREPEEISVDPAPLRKPDSSLLRPAPAPDISAPVVHSQEELLDTAGAFWKALRANRLGLALALLEVGALGTERRLFEPALKLTAAALVAVGDGEIDDSARAAAESVLAAWQGDAISRSAGLSGAALLLPTSMLLAVLAPGSNEAGLLTALVHPGRNMEGEPARSLPTLCAMAKTVASTATALGGGFLTGRDVLADLVAEDGWRLELRRHCEGVRAWQQAQLARQLRFAGATDVWHAMLRAEGTLGPLLNAAAADDTVHLNAIRGQAEDFRVDSALRQSELDVRGKMAARTAPIHGPVRRELEALVEEALQQIRGWITLRGRTTHSSTGRAGPIREVRATLAERLPGARNELIALTGNAASATHSAIVVLDRLGALLNGNAPQPVVRRIDELLGQDLLPVETIRFYVDWRRDTPLDSRICRSLVTLADAEPQAFALAPAVRRRISCGDIEGAELALSLVGDETAAAVLESELRSAAEFARGSALQSMESLRREIEEAERTGRIETGPAQGLVELIERQRVALERATATEIGPLLRQSESERDIAVSELRDASKKVHERIRLRLENIERPIGERERSQVNGALQLGQFAIAEDLVERLEDGEPLSEPLPPPPVQQRFDAFFPSRADRLASWLRAWPDGFRQLCHVGRSVPIDLSAGAERDISKDIASLAEAWIGCAANRGSELARSLTRLLEGFGFTEPELQGFSAPPQRASEALFRLSVRPLRDRATAVLPEYGSVAAVNYSLLCLWQKRDAEDIGQALARHPTGSSATIVLFFGILDVEQRRRLAAMARADRLRTALVIDDVLALHLALLPEARLPTVFACALPFTATRPWADTGTPPPEMFFGRQREMSAVAARSGEFTHLIYGGRQLGKTALLRQVERAAGETPQTIARYLNIAQIGLTQQPNELWDVLVGELSRAGVTISLPAGRSPTAAFRSQVLDWLGKNPAKSILLLLDEADGFFAKDRADRFQVTEALRTLSVDSDRRFKPVFAGLRNVQKLARDPNSPLAHLGQPLVVGPLIKGQERVEAEALVRWPFAALGYRMDLPVVTRILAFANYYPSLIQVICQRLLRSLRQRHGGVGPPWVVQMDDVERVLESRELREAALERFRITLELDQRYNLVALLAAQLSMSDPQLLARGINIPDLREWAAMTWPAGFPPDLGEDAFDALLAEMEGLGLLRRVDGTHYALRSANLAHLIGTQKEISRQIDSFADSPALRSRNRWSGVGRSRAGQACSPRGKRRSC
jgi:hypothetical protein